MTGIKIKLAALVFVVLLSCGASKKVTNRQVSKVIVILPDTPAMTKKAPEFDSIQIKYAKRLKVDQEEIKNVQLYHFIDKWMHTPYKWGGTDEKGIDCSAFIQLLLQGVYKINLPRTSVQQFLTQQVEPFNSINFLSEGDLVFFKTLDNTIVSHVGLYLHNGSFVNASSSKGVSIASLDDAYWKKRFVAAGRVRISIAGKQ